MKATEIMKLIELGQTFKPKVKRRRKYDDFDFRDLDITMLLHKKLEEAEALKKLLEDREKAHKKEEKKENKWSMHQIAMFLVLTFPITAPAYVAYIKALIH